MLFHLLVPEFIYLAHQSVQEVTVVADENQGAVKIQQTPASGYLWFSCPDGWSVRPVSTDSPVRAGALSWQGVYALHRKSTLTFFNGFFGAAEHEGSQQVAYLVADFPFGNVVYGLEHG